MSEIYPLKSSMIKIKKIQPCNVLRKLCINSYEIELPEDIGISPIFNVEHLYSYRMDDIEGKNHGEEIQWK
jgi:hypothetical protein